MITITSNSLESGDWIRIKNDEEVIFEGHTPTIYDIEAMFIQLGHSCLREGLTDKEMEETA
jgi:hypothetical protein